MTGETLFRSVVGSFLLIYGGWHVYRLWFHLIPKSRAAPARNDLVIAVYLALARVLLGIVGGLVVLLRGVSAK